jgi:hypothetical protein
MISMMMKLQVRLMAQRDWFRVRACIKVCIVGGKIVNVHATLVLACSQKDQVLKALCIMVQVLVVFGSGSDQRVELICSCYHYLDHIAVMSPLLMY